MQTRLFDWAYEQGISIADLAERCGYNRWYLYQIRRGAAPITQAFRDRIVIGLGAEAEALFWRDDDPEVASLALPRIPNNPRYRKTLEQRYAEKVQKGADDQCWPWTGAQTTRWAKDGRGYGVLWTGEGYTYAHRLAWEYAHGSIPHGMFVCHHCDYPPCVNPAHLFLGTSDDNTQDMIAKGRRVLACSKDTERNNERRAKAEEMRARYARGEKVVDIAEDVGLSRATVSSVVHGHTWTASVDEEYLDRLHLLKHGAKITGAIAASIVEQIAAGASGGQMARKYGVNIALISRIRNGKVWTQATEDARRSLREIYG